MKTCNRVVSEAVKTRESELFRPGSYVNPEGRDNIFVFKHFGTPIQRNSWRVEWHVICIGRRKLREGGMAEHFDLTKRNFTVYFDLESRYKFFHINGSVKVSRWEG